MTKIVWNVFDPDAEFRETYRDLPHRDQTGALTFVTFRLADSMPLDDVTQWKNELQTWLTENNLKETDTDIILRDPKISQQIKRNLRRYRDERWHFHLDACHGECLLRQQGISQEVAKSLLYFNSVRYDIERFVIMPNHVHVMVQIRWGFDLRKQFREVQRYSARQINFQLNREGPLWQGEPFDHIVRSVLQFRYLQQYIYDNTSTTIQAKHTSKKEGTSSGNTKIVARWSPPSNQSLWLGGPHRVNLTL